MDRYDRDLRSMQEARDKARAGARAAEEIATFSEEKIDFILQNMVRVAEANKVMLAEMAHKETGFGNVYDKTFKNHLASTLFYNEIKDMKCQGVLSDDEEKQVMEIAFPAGLVMGITPSTNPTSTIIFKAICAIKARDAIIFAPHPAALNCSIKAAELMAVAAEEAGAPVGTISVVTTPTMEASNWLMRCPEVKLIIATGGPGMVKAAYAAGKPAVGVGNGNSPAYIEKSANIQQAVQNIKISKTFDQGLICASEQSIVVEEANKDAVIAEMKKQGYYFMTREQTQKVQNIIFKPGTHNMNSKFVGRKAEVIAAEAGFTVPEGTVILVGEQDGVGPDYPLSYEKLTQVIAFYTVYNWKEAHDLCERLLQHGLGHTFSIHTESKDMVMKFSDMPVCRIMVNSPSAQGGVGGCNNLLISYTLGAGTIGGSAVSENVGPQNFINKKVIAWATVDLSDLKAIDPTWDYDPEPEAPAADAFANAFANNTAANGITQDQLNEIVNLMVKSLKGEK
jgi:acetaldehyde dehydrogenase (acetylating)